ncbi:MAG: hypothetical protein Ct9H300mP16_18240 [Pseudomonadota bacterium]|nr:MAG: hypothetical protein Ct9H300mP16_18240 [Pseudomonadota bacterium]
MKRVAPAAGADLAEVFEDPQILAQDLVLDVEHPGHGSVRMTGFPVKLSERRRGSTRART